MTDEIFEESDVRFRICHEDAKSGIGTGAILEQVVPAAATGKRRKSESAAATEINGKDKAGKAAKQLQNQQRAYSKQPGQSVDGSEESDNAKLPSNLGNFFFINPVLYILITACKHCRFCSKLYAFAITKSRF